MSSLHQLQDGRVLGYEEYGASEGRATLCYFHGVVAGLAPLDQPGMVAGMGGTVRRLFELARARPALSRSFLRCIGCPRHPCCLGRGVRRRHDRLINSRTSAASHAIVAVMMVAVRQPKIPGERVDHEARSTTKIGR